MTTPEELMEIMKDAVKISLTLFIVKEILNVGREPSVEEIRRIIKEETERAIQRGLIQPPAQRPQSL